MVLDDAVAQEAVDELQELRPFAKPLPQRRKRRFFGCGLIFRQAPGEKRQRLVRRHSVHLLALGFRRQDVIAARGDETCGVAPALQEGAQILFAPSVVDDEKDAPVSQRFPKRGRRIIHRLNVWWFACHTGNEIGNNGDQVFGLLAKLGPEDAVEIGVGDVRVVGERFRERGLAIAARAAQRRRDGDRVALRVEQFALERLELDGPLNEVGRRSGAIMGTRFWLLGPSSTRFSNSRFSRNVRS